MDSPNWPESLPSTWIEAIQKLTQGEKWTNKLRDVLQRSDKTDSDHTTIDGVVVQILEMFENTISIMGSRSFDEPLQLPKSELNSSCSSDCRKSENSEESPKTVIPVKMKRGCYKRRKNSWTSTKVTSVLIDDGHAWRKYGQKEILNTKHQRSYYRCTYKFDQGCQATKQVQKIGDKPPSYKITYFGNHSCENLQRAPPILLNSTDPRDTSVVLNFETPKQLINRKQVDPDIPTIKYEHEEGFPPQGNLNHKRSFFSRTYQHVSPISLDSSSVMSSVLDHEYRVYSRLDHGDISSTAYLSMPSSQGSQMDRMFVTNDFNYFLF